MPNLTQATASQRPQVVAFGGGYAVEFNVSASPQFLHAPALTSMQGATTYSFAAWFAIRGDLTSSSIVPPIFMFMDGDSTTTGIGISYHDFQTSICMTSTGTNPNDQARIPLSNIADDQMFHVCGTVDGSAVNIYLNGSSEVSASNGNAMPSNLSGYDLIIGGAMSGGRWVPICASNLQIWDIALTAQEVQDWAMQRLTGTLPSGLVFYAPL